MPKHEFGIMQIVPKQGKRYDEYEPQKYNCISVDDDYVENIVVNLNNIDIIKDMFVIVGGIYDDRLLVKPVKPAISLMSDATYEFPYEGAKEMLLVDDVDNKDFLTQLFNAILL